MSRIAVIAGEPRSLPNFRGDLLETMRAAGHEVVTIGPPASEATLAWLATRGIPYHEAPIGRAGISPLADIRTFLKLLSLLREIGPEIVLTYTIKPNVYGIPAAALAGVKRRNAMITGLGFAFIERKGSLRWRVIHIIARMLYWCGLRLATRVIFQNEDDLDTFREMGLIARKAPVGIVAGSGVDIHRFAPAPLPEEPRFLMVARLLRDKGLAEYIEAAKTVRARFPKAEFHLVGPADPSPAAYPLAEVEAATREGAIIWHGATEDVRPFIAASRIYVLPSYREGTPRSALEAMAMGRPVITTDVPGCRAAVEHGRNGLLVPAHAAGPLAEAMIRLIEEPRLVEHMGAEGRAIAEKTYDVRKVTAEILRLCGIEAARKVAQTS